MDPIEIFLPMPLYLVVVLAALAVLGYRSARDSAVGRARHVLLALALWSWALTTPGPANRVVAAMEGPVTGSAAAPAHLDGRTVIVVMASGILYSRNGKPHPRLDASGWERLREGIRLWRQDRGLLVLTGGPDGDPDLSLAGLMRSIAEEAGVPAGSIAISPRSSNTYEDLLGTRQLIASHGGKAVLVTSALHMPRALAVTRKLGMDMLPHPCDYRQIEDPTWRIWVPDNGGPALWADVLHEIVGRQYYRLQGWSD